jgi:tartrate dehydrogenase/decarboxylase/D-malate dehydrogenase
LWFVELLVVVVGVLSAADLLMRAVEQVCAAGILTPDLGGKATTADVTRAVCQAVRGLNR